jgi:glycosyltransferase involved in cell wall biosynthesis
MTKKRILQFATYAGMGGTQQELLKLLRHASRDKYEFCVCVLLGRGVLNDEAAKLQIENLSLNMRGYWDVSAWWKLYRYARRKRFDLICTYGLKGHLIGRIVGRLAGIPANITSVQSTDPWRKWYHALLDYLTSGLTDLYLSNSEAGRQATHRRERIPWSKIVTIPNGVELSRCTPRTWQQPEAAAAYRRELGLTPTDRIVGIVASLRRMKGHATLVDALPRILQDAPDVKCLFVGGAFVKEPAYEAELREYVRARGLAEHVIFTGFRQDVPELVSLFDVFVLPSLWEGLPSSILEAMALKKPVVATPVGGIPELVEPRVTGLLIPPNDPTALAEAVLTVLNDPARAAQMGQAGYDRIRTHFTLASVVTRTEAVYDHLLGMQTSEVAPIAKTKNIKV